MRVLDSLKTGMINQMHAADIITNNLANSSSTGFKKILSSIAQTNRQQEPVLLSQLDYSQGPMVQTDNPLDCAFEGDGYFAIQTDTGIKYTRNGCFKLSPAGELLTTGNKKVLGIREPEMVLEPIVIKGETIVIKENGEVYVDGARVSKLKIVSLQGNAITQDEGSALLSCPAGNVRDKLDGRVRQHFLEGSNVSPVEEMVRLVEKYRIFQTFGKMIQVQDDLAAKAAQINSN